MDLQSLVVEEDPNTFETQINVPRENLSMVENSQTNKWILEKHNMWTKITLNSFYEECAAGTVTCAQLTKWVYDRYKIAESQLIYCDIFGSIFGKQTDSFCAVVREDVEWFENKLHQLLQLSNSQLRECQPTYGAQELIDYNNKAMDKEWKPCSCLLHCWLINFAFYQGWRMTLRHYQCDQIEIMDIAKWSSREELMVAIIDVQQLLDRVLRESGNESLLLELALSFDEATRDEGVLFKMWKTRALPRTMRLQRPYLKKHMRVLSFSPFWWFGHFGVTPTVEDYAQRDGVPEPGESLLQVISQFQSSRSSLVCDIVSGGSRTGSILFSTRFGETSNIHCIAGPGACREQQTFFNEPVYEALWQPGGKGFAYLKDTGGSENFSVFYMDMETGLHYPVSKTQKGRCGAMVWNEDGSSLCYYSTERNGRDWDIYVVDFRSHKDQFPQITDPRIIFQDQGSWSPMDFYRSRLLLRKFVSLEESYVYLMDLNNPSLWVYISPSFESELDSSKAAVSFAKFLRISENAEDCPIALVSDSGEDFHTLRIYDPLGKPLCRVETSLSGDIEELAVASYWRPNISMFAFTVNDGGSFELFLGNLQKHNEDVKVDLCHISLQNTAVLNPTSNEPCCHNMTSPTSSQPAARNLNACVIRRLRINASLGLLAFSRYSPTSPGDIYTVQVDTKVVRRWTLGEVGGLDRKRFVNPYLIEFESFDGLKIPCWMYLPRSDSKRFPVLIHIHGGPEQQSLPVFSPLFQYLLLEKGIAILDPNVRGSSGYGKHYMSLDDQYKRKDAVKDIGSLLDWIDKQPFLSNQHIALLGGSYGGFMVLSSIIEYGNRIRAAVDMVGISNFVSYLERTSAYRRDSRRKEYGDERDPEMRKFLLSISPLTHSHRIQVPLFVAAGQNDPRVPASESEQIVQAVRKNGLECWYMIAKDEGHGYQKKSNRVYWNSLVSVFLERHLFYPNGTPKL